MGFTLIELLFVISIIGLLAVSILASLNVARVKARDARRLQDIRQIQNALNLYFDKYNYYPRSGLTGSTECMTGSFAPSPTVSWCNSVTGGDQWIRNTRTDGGAADLRDFFPVSVPKDPINNASLNWNLANEYGYFYYSGNESTQNNQGYVMRFRLEDEQRAQQLSITVKGTDCITSYSYSATIGAAVGISPPNCP